MVFRLLVILVITISASLSVAAEPYQLQVPLGLKAPKIPKSNPLTAEKIALGKQLYFDKRLSADNTVSCASCHDPKKGWSNGEATAEGIQGQRGGRGAPTVLNAAYQTRHTFWDGRAKQTSALGKNALEVQALGPIENPIEMGIKLDDLIPKLNKIEGYRSQFQAVFGSDVTSDGIAKAIASFERTVLSGNAPYDRFKAGDTKALSESAQRGWKLFSNKASCTNCHAGSSFTDQAFHNLGVGMDKEKPDLGRFAVTNLPGDKGRFKTPTLRDIARTAPYMHDGRFATLEEVVDFYNQGGIANPHLDDEDIFPLKLTDDEKQDLVNFLKEGLASDDYPDVAPPELPE